MRSYLDELSKMLDSATLGMNDEALEKDQRTQGRWANSEEDLENQVLWIRKNAPEI